MTIDAKRIAAAVSRITQKDEDEILQTRDFERLGMDSLDKIEVLMEVEDEFNVHISDEDSMSIHCIDTLIGAVERALANT